MDSYGDREFIYSYLGNARPQASSYDAWAQSMPNYINPLSEATLNGHPFSDLYSQLSNPLHPRMKALEDEIYDYSITDEPKEGMYAQEDTHKRKRDDSEANVHKIEHETKQPTKRQHLDVMPASPDDSTPVDAEDADGDPKTAYKAVRSRESSRRYRARKKESFEKMKRQVDQFEAEKRAWAKERDSAQKAIDHLTQENVSLKDQHQSEAFKVREDRLNLLSLLEDKLRCNAPVSELVPIINEVRDRCAAIKELSQNLLRQFISPDAAIYLAGNGFFRKEALEFDRPSKSHSLFAFASKIQSELTDMTNEQHLRLQTVVEEFYADLRRIVDERQLIARDLEMIYKGVSVEPSGEECESPLLDRLVCVQHLRENLITESDLAFTTVGRLLDVLTAMQAARFLVKAHFVHTGVMQLQMLWDALKHNPQNLPPCPLIDDSI